MDDDAGLLPLLEGLLNPSQLEDLLASSLLHLQPHFTAAAPCEGAGAAGENFPRSCEQACSRLLGPCGRSGAERAAPHGNA